MLIIFLVCMLWFGCFGVLLLGGVAVGFAGYLVLIAFEVWVVCGYVGFPFGVSLFKGFVMVICLVDLTNCGLF